MPTIIVKDAYRAAVEAASGGQQTVLYDDKGYPSIMNIIPKFNLEDIDAGLGTGIHPAFSKAGVEKSELFIGTYPSIISDGRGLSLPGIASASGMTYDEAKGYCTAKGPGWHLMTVFERAALALWCAKNGHKPRGNTNYGRSHAAHYETGVREDGAAPGLTSGIPYTIPGSGSATWNHNLASNGIVDLVGNRNEWVDLLKLVDGRVYCPSDNAFEGDEANWTARDVYFDSSAAYSDDDTVQNIGHPILSDGITHRTGAAGVIEDYDDYVTVTWNALTNKDGFSTPELMKQLMVAPISPAGASDLSLQSEGLLYIRNNGERVPYWGGNYCSGANAGLGRLSLNYGRTLRYSSITFRVAFCL